ncbi:O-antigen ligase family protein [Mycolicibacterium sp. Dal123E01]|uniref:O-antigen ligase family protein n=1 Tax=Mycolicibacterium sp. Dal123E01 TaxID=3457578 RepID=UPI00403E8E4E
MAAFLVPRNALPAAALWLLVLLPIGYMQIPTLVGRYLMPPVLLIAIWMLRLALAQRGSLLLRIPMRGWLIVASLLVLLFTSSVFSVRLDITVAWMIVFLVCVIGPALVGQICFDDVWPTVRWTLACIGLFLGVVAAVDYLIQFNPWTSMYVIKISKFSVFRTRTSLGHPLTTSMVASVALAACIFPTSGTRQWPYWICAMGTLVAIILSVSRTSVLAVGASALVGMLSALPHATRVATRKGTRRSRLLPLLMAATFIATLTLSPLLNNRNTSEEGISSASVRSELLDVSINLISQHPFLGFGPGASERVYDYHNQALENSALQLMVSIGLPAFALIVIGFGVIVVGAMRRSRAGVAAGIVAFWASATGFNILDSNTGFYTLLAPLIVCAVMPGPGHAAQSEGASETLDSAKIRPGGDDGPTPKPAVTSQRLTPGNPT